MEAAKEELLDLWPLKSDRLEVPFVVVVEESQSFSSICEKKTHTCLQNEQLTLKYAATFKKQR